MFNYLRFRRRVSRLEREEYRLRNESNAAIQAAKRRKAADEEIKQLEHDNANTQIHFKEEIHYLA